MTDQTELSYLFGGSSPWNAGQWTDSDDRVRGGRSQSHLRCGSGSAEFYGQLDTTALGGAGFASQRTTGDLDRDLSQYEGLVINLASSDGLKYTLTLKDEILPRRDDGRERSSVSWEYDFKPGSGKESRIVIPWHDFKPTYRGKPKLDAKPLDLSNIKRVSFMMRSFFGEQQGDFKLVIKDVAVFTERPRTATTDGSITKEAQSPHPSPSTWKSWICGWF